MQIQREGICMQTSRNIANGPKCNNYVLVGIWIIVCIQKPSHEFLQAFRPLRMIKIAFLNYHFIQNNCRYFACYGWSVQTSTKRCHGKHEYGIKLWRLKQRTPNVNDTIRHWMKLPHQWHTQKIFTGGSFVCALFLTSQFDVIFMFLNQPFGEVCWHNMHIFLHPVPLFYVPLHWI